MFLIVGLGNPGAQYARTKHNIGWMVLDELSRRWTIQLSRTNCEAKIGGGVIGEQRAVLAKPQTFMNLSGRSVAALMRYQNVPRERLLSSPTTSICRLASCVCVRTAVTAGITV